ncbi:hypothetical protein IKF15_02420 [Candidatus Saccharibacteria bacterium]|nr:hypothetical protein [Candidatus Saccharibacteria bacterium]
MGENARKQEFVDGDGYYGGWQKLTTVNVGHENNSKSVAGEDATGDKPKDNLLQFPVKTEQEAGGGGEKGDETKNDDEKSDETRNDDEKSDETRNGDEKSGETGNGDTAGAETVSSTEDGEEVVDEALGRSVKGGENVVDEALNHSADGEIIAQINGEQSGQGFVGGDMGEVRPVSEADAGSETHGSNLASGEYVNARKDINLLGIGKKVEVDKKERTEAGQEKKTDETWLDKELRRKIEALRYWADKGTPETYMTKQGKLLGSDIVNESVKVGVGEWGDQKGKVLRDKLLVEDGQIVFIQNYRAEEDSNYVNEKEVPVRRFFGLGPIKKDRNGNPITKTKWVHVPTYGRISQRKIKLDDLIADTENPDPDEAELAKHKLNEIISPFVKVEGLEMPEAIKLRAQIQENKQGSQEKGMENKTDWMDALRFKVKEEQKLNAYKNASLQDVEKWKGDAMVDYVAQKLEQASPAVRARVNAVKYDTQIASLKEEVTDMQDEIRSLGFAFPFTRKARRKRAMREELAERQEELDAVYREKDEVHIDRYKSATLSDDEREEVRDFTEIIGKAVKKQERERIKALLKECETIIDNNLTGSITGDYGQIRYPIVEDKGPRDAVIKRSLYNVWRYSRRINRYAAKNPDFKKDSEQAIAFANGAKYRELREAIDRAPERGGW